MTAAPDSGAVPAERPKRKAGRKPKGISDDMPPAAARLARTLDRYWPDQNLKVISKSAHCSVASASKVRRGMQVPSWAVLKTLTDYMRVEYTKSNGGDTGDFPSREAWYQMYVHAMLEAERSPDAIGEEKDGSETAGSGAPLNPSHGAGAARAGRTDGRTVRLGVTGVAARMARVAAMGLAVFFVWRATPGMHSELFRTLTLCASAALVDWVLRGDGARGMLAASRTGLPPSIRMIARLLTITRCVWPSKSHTQWEVFMEESIEMLWQVRRELPLWQFWLCATCLFWSSLRIGVEERVHRRRR